MKFLRWTVILGAGRRSCEEPIRDVSLVPSFAAFIFRPWAELVLLCAVFVWADDPPSCTHVTHLRWLFIAFFHLCCQWIWGTLYALYFQKEGYIDRVCSVGKKRELFLLSWHCPLPGLDILSSKLLSCCFSCLFTPFLFAKVVLSALDERQSESGSVGHFRQQARAGSAEGVIWTLFLPSSRAALCSYDF